MLEFVRRNRIVCTSGLLLLFSLILLSTSASTRRRMDPLTGIVLDGMWPLQRATAATVQALAGAWRTYVDLVGIRQENERLRRRVVELEQQAIRLAEVEQTDKRLEEVLNFRATLVGDLIVANIIARDPLPWFSSLTIDKGAADGVQKNAAVLSPFGVVGQTMTAGRHATRILLLTDHNSGIDAVVQRSRARGIVEGALDGRCVMKYVKRGEDLEVGDRVVTSGLDGIFPKGIMIGEVTRVTRGTRGLLQVADIQPSVPLDRIEEVLVARGAVQSAEQLP
ncbi:MAG: rod shape-determining protein MreC [Deltaproteobacteria bacterium]|nr:rod shape-determining protein MreC [Deltaproteobacteria bacterium]